MVRITLILGTVWHISMTGDIFRFSHPRRFRFSWGVLLIGSWLGTSVSLAQNLAQNPGFENGNTAGWFAFGPPSISVQTTQVHSGGYAALIQNRTASYNGIAQSLQGVIQPGQTYMISGWVRIPGSAAQTIQMTMKKSDAGGDTYTAMASGAASSS